MGAYVAALAVSGVILLVLAALPLLSPKTASAAKEQSSTAPASTASPQHSAPATAGTDREADEASPPKR